MPQERAEVSVLSLTPFPICPPHVLPYLLQVKMVLGLMWGQFGAPARNKQGCSTWHPSSSIEAVFHGVLALVSS